MMKFSSDPFSELNLARKDYNNARLAISDANQGLVAKSWAMRNFNHARKRLRDICLTKRGKALPVRYTPSFATTVNGIPCGVVVDYYRPAIPCNVFALPEDCYPDEPSEFEFHLIDRGGYRAEWLMNQLTDEVKERIENEYTQNT